MDRLDQLVPFVNSQAAFHEKKAKQIKADPKRSNFHMLQAKKLHDMAGTLSEAQVELDKYAALLKEQAEKTRAVPAIQRL
jgi:hypothetical protein